MKDKQTLPILVQSDDGTTTTITNNNNNSNNSPSSSSCTTMERWLQLFCIFNMIGLFIHFRVGEKIGLLLTTKATETENDNTNDNKSVLSLLSEQQQLHHHDYEEFNDDGACKTKSIIDYWKQHRTLDLARNLPVTTLPTKSQPFFLFGGGGGGSSANAVLLQESINMAANLSNLDAWISSTTSSIPPTNHRFDIYASSMDFSTAMKIYEVDAKTFPKALPSSSTTEVTIRRSESQQQEQEQQPSTTTTTFTMTRRMGDPLYSCMVYLQPTINRMVSCWNDYAATKKKVDLPDANQIHPNDWYNALSSTMSSSCTKNAFVTVFGNFILQEEEDDESLSSRLLLCPADCHHHHNDSSTTSTQQLLQQLQAIDVETILERMSRCVMIHSNRCDESKEVISHYLPWLKESFQCDDDEQQQQQHLSNETKQGILNATSYEYSLYEYGKVLFEEQLKHARRSSSS